MAVAPAVARESRRFDHAAEDGPPTTSSEVSRGAAFAIALAVLAGLILRLYTRSELWLDEALTVHIAEVPLSQLTEALRRDGAPPLYYLLLHGWMTVFGDGNQAVRLLSAVFSAATLPLAFRAGRRLGGPVVAVAALVLLATSPFAIRYATETRMYSLVALLVTAGYLALVRALERPTPLRLAALGAASGGLLLTHYWSFYLVATTGVALMLLAWRRPARRAEAVRVIGAIGVGSVVLFGPWVPHFLYQAAHTGTPWGIAPGPIEVAFTTLVDLGGGPYPEGQALAGLLAALALLALLGRAVDGHRIELDLRTRPGVRAEALVGAVTLVVAVGAGVLTASAFATRYTSVVFPLIVLTAAYGLRSLADRRIVAAVLVVATLAGLVGGVRNVVLRRTSADTVAALIASNGGRAGDLVVYCPDQLGPDVTRVLAEGYEESTFPDGADPRIVDWVDYGDRMRAADPLAFAADVLDRSAGRAIWYVWMPGYRTLGKHCQRINDAFGNARPGNRQLLEPDETAFERHVLWLHPAKP